MGPFEKWATSLRLSWMGQKGQAIVGGLAAALGDNGVAWARAAVFEHFPSYAQDPDSIGLLASAAQVDAAVGEATDALAARVLRAPLTSKLYGSQLGVLLALYYAGFPHALLVQQNGAAFQIVGTPNLDDVAGFFAMPPVIPSWWQVTTLANGPYVGATGSSNQPLAAGANPWWVFDSTGMDGGTPQQQWNSRFAILFPGPLYPDAMTTWNVGTALFDGTQDGSGGHPWPFISWATPFASAYYHALIGPAYVSDGSGPITVDIDGQNKNASAMTVRASSPFAGAVDAIAWQATGLAAADLARLQGIIDRWRNARALCVGIYVVQDGRCLGWPVPSKLSDLAPYWGKSTVLSYPVT